MSRISVDVSSARIPVLEVGYQGENEVTDVLFDISSWIAEFGEGVAQLRVKRPGNSEEESYVLSLTITDGIALWTVSETDTFNKGNGKVQLSYLVGNIVKKAVIYPYKVGKSIVGADNPVDPFDSWIERSKAWAIGETLYGDAVPETDETYQNNAKYYAEQADILGSAQVVLATEQVTLATEKATLATEKAGAAAESEANAAASEAAVNGVSTQLTTRMSAIETEQSVQSARMDTFTSLPEGSTSGNAELADIRVGADGTTYDTAGNAVRGHISELKSDLDERTKLLSSVLFNPKINEIRDKYYSKNDVLVDASGYVCKYTDKIPCSEGDIFTYKGHGEFSAISWILYDRNAIVSFEALDCPTETEIVIPPNVKYIRFASVKASSNFNDCLLEIKCKTLSENDKVQIRNNIDAIDEQRVKEVAIQKEIIQSINLYDNSLYVPDKWIDPTCIEADSPGYGHTKPFFLKAGTYITNCYKGGYGANALYFHMCDKDGNNCSRGTGELLVDDGANSIMKIIIPNDSYVMLNSQNAYYQNMMVVEGAVASDFPAEFIPYVHKYIVEEGIKLNNTMREEIDEMVYKNPLNGKKLALDGDSVMAGAGFAGGFGKIVADRNNMTVSNIAVGGGTLSAENYTDGGSARHWICRSVESMPADYDYYIFAGGINDASLGVSVGSVTTGYNATLDDTTVAGAMEKACKTILTTFPGKKCGYVFEHRMLGDNTNWETQYKPAMVEALEKWGVPYLDLDTLCPPLNHIDSLKSEFTLDGWHPNEAGYRAFYCDKFESWLKTL